MNRILGARPSHFVSLLLSWAVVVLTTLGASTSASARFLEPEQAFRFSARAVDGATIEVRYAIADGYYLYRERFRFALDPQAAGGVTLGEPVFPKGEIKFDETFQKDVEHYRREVVVRVPVVAPAGGATGPLTLVSTSQGCADAGLCYPPQEARATLTLPAAGTPTTSPSPAAALGVAADDPSRIERALRSGNLGWIVALFVGLGVLLAFTPCMLPMLPILSSIIVGQHGAHATRRGGFVLALVYSLGMALVYTLLGVVAGLAGEGLAAALQTPLILGVFATLLVVLSLSMFGFYELQVPAGLQAQLARWSNRAGSTQATATGHASPGRHAGVFAMGVISALIVGPCVAAPLAGALLYISQTRDVLVGGVALFSLAAGMSVPLLAVGASAGALLPRTGAWMDTVKHFFGVLLIGVALWMVTPVVPAWVPMLGWAAIAIIASVSLRLFDPLGPDAPGRARFAKGVGALLFVAGVVEFVGLATGARDALQPLSHLVSRDAGEARAARADQAPRFEIVKTAADLDRRVAVAGKPVMLDFYADWCVSCKEMERDTYTDARVAARMQGFLLLKADVTANDADDRALLKRFRLFGPPGIVFFDRDGRLRAGASVIGFQDADRFLESLSNVEGSPAQAARETGEVTRADVPQT